MKMLKLVLENLKVDTFDTMPVGKGRGTVFAEQCTCPTACTCPGCPTCAATCEGNQTCWETCAGPTCAETCAGGSCQTQCFSLKGEYTCTCIE
jgi:hypothetical protein